MTPQKQTVFGEGSGNCWATCLAALLDLPVSEVPNFCGSPERNPAWYSDTDHWLQQRGLRIVGITFPENNIAMPPEKQIGMTLEVGAYLIVTGKSPRGDFYHSIVVEYMGDNEWGIACDPHPSGAGLDGPWVSCDMIVVSSRQKGNDA